MAKSEFKLPRSILGRIVFALLCLGLMPASLFLFYVSVFDLPAPQTLCEWIIALIVGVVLELIALGLFAFTFFGLIWSFAGSDWAARLLQAGFRKLSYTLATLTVIFCTLIAAVTIMALLGVIK